MPKQDYTDAALVAGSADPERNAAEMETAMTFGEALADLAPLSGTVALGRKPRLRCRQGTTLASGNCCAVHGAGRRRARGWQI
jgi:hypothetical protein